MNLRTLLWITLFVAVSFLFVFLIVVDWSLNFTSGIAHCTYTDAAQTQTKTVPAAIIRFGLVP